MIYFDNAATTPIFKEALEAYDEVSLNDFGNSESNHAVGHNASRLLERARRDILVSLGLEKTHELVFTSGATESNNLGLKGAALRYKNRGMKLITSNIEHPSVTRPLKQLADLLGFDLVILPIGNDGTISPDTLAKAMDKDVSLVSIMAVNNETGAANDIGALGKIVHQYPKAIFHVDATQAMGKWVFPYSSADLMSFSGHKFGGPKGTGALVYKKNLSFVSINAGGEQENGFRAGTVNVPGMVSMSKALNLSLSRQQYNEKNASSMYEELYSFLKEMPEQVELNSAPLSLSQSPFVLNFSLKKKKASVVVEALSNEGIYVSSVSACSSHEAQRSYVVLAYGKSEEDAENSIRVSFSIENTMEELKRFETSFAGIIKEINDR